MQMPLNSRAQATAGAVRGGKAPVGKRQRRPGGAAAPPPRHRMRVGELPLREIAISEWAGRCHKNHMHPGLEGGMGIPG